MSRTLALVVVFAAGCPAGGDDNDVDGGVDTTGLRITWAAVPPLPGPVAPDRTVQDLNITYSSVQLGGDAAPPGDPRTKVGTTVLDWDDRGTPPPIELPDAPPGRYQDLYLGLGGQADRLRIVGQVDLNGTWTPFEIEDEQAPSSSLSLSIDVRPGELTTLPLELDVAAVLAVIPFAELDMSEGHLELHTEDRQMSAVRTALKTAFHVAGAPEL